jgi:hypothetical protein
MDRPVKLNVCALDQSDRKDLDQFEGSPFSRNRGQICPALIQKSTIFARNYGTAAVISYNLKGIAPPPVLPIQCWAERNRMSGCAAPTLKRGGGGNVSVNGILQPNACEN